MFAKIATGLFLCFFACSCASTGQDSNPIPSQEGSASPSTPTSSTPGNYWVPAISSSFQWQLSGTLDTSVNASVFDIDLFDTDAAVIQQLHEQGKKVICYVSVGSWEDWRDDAKDFPAQVLGKDYEGWPGEKWLDIRRIDLLGPILEKRFDMAKSKGCDAIEPDNMDGFENDTGFPLSAGDQLTFNRWLAEAAHQRSMSIGLKNDSGQAKDLVDLYDWALTEDCHVDGWCEEMKPFIAKGKAVFQVEYTDNAVALDDFCPGAKQNQFVAILKNRDLDAFRKACP